MASMKFKKACVAFATTPRGIDPYRIVTAAQKEPETLYAALRDKKWQWSKKYQCWQKR